MTAAPAQTFEQWLQQLWPASLLAIGGCDARDKPFFRSLSPDSTLRIRDESWQTLNEALAQLAVHGCSEGESLWVFESALLWVVRRTDGAWAGVLTPRELAESAVVTLDARLSDFLHLDA